MNVHPQADTRPLPPDNITRGCPFAWCTLDHPGHDEHTAENYVRASMSAPWRTNLMVGAGVHIESAERGPEIFVHISDDDASDEDAYLSIDEATDLVDALIVAISRARNALAVTR